MISTHVWKLRASEVGALLGRNKYKPTSKALADVFARHHKTRWARAKKVARAQDPEEIGRLALRSCGAAKAAIGAAVLNASPESTSDALKCVHDAVVMNHEGVVTRSMVAQVEKKAQAAVDVAKKIIYTEIGKRKEDASIDQYAQKTRRDVQQRNSQMFRLRGDGWIMFGMIDGYDEETRTVIEHKQRQNRLFRHLPAYERVQCFIYMKMTSSTRALLVQTFKDTQSTFEVHWDAQEWEQIEQGLRETVIHLNELLYDHSARVALAEHIYK